MHTGKDTVIPGQADCASPDLSHLQLAVFTGATGVD